MKKEEIEEYLEKIINNKLRTLVLVKSKIGEIYLLQEYHGSSAEELHNNRVEILEDYIEIVKDIRIGELSIEYLAERILEDVQSYNS